MTTRTHPAPRTSTPREITRDATTAATRPRVAFSLRTLVAIATSLMVLGGLLVVGGLGGATYTYRQAAAQGIVTPDDARFAGVDVRGPMSMWAQADIINFHQLNSTEGRYFSQMDRQVQAVDEAGAPVVDEAGEPVMIANAARASWITATTLTTALGVGMLAYGVSAMAIVIGLGFALIGAVVLRLRRTQLVTA